VKIFVSYSRKDANDFAERISEVFGDEHVFTDVDDIQMGDPWSSIIEQNISTCDIFVIIVTFASLKSPEVEKEVLQAQKEKKTIIPCFFRKIKRDDIKWGLGDLQGIEFKDKDELAREIYYRINISGQPRVETEPRRTTTPPSTRTEPRVETEPRRTTTPPSTRTESPVKTERPKIFASIEDSSLKKEEKHRPSGSKKILLILAVAIGVVIAGITSVYFSMNAPEQVKEGTKHPPIAAHTAASPITIDTHEVGGASFAFGDSITPSEQNPLFFHFKSDDSLTFTCRIVKIDETVFADLLTASGLAVNNINLVGTEISNNNCGTGTESDVTYAKSFPNGSFAFQVIGTSTNGTGTKTPWAFEVVGGTTLRTD
jgi:hypothetical protein